MLDTDSTSQVRLVTSQASKSCVWLMAAAPGSQPGTTVPPRAHLAACGDILGRPIWVRGWGDYGHHLVGRVRDAAKYLGAQDGPTKNGSDPNVKSREFPKSYRAQLGDSSAPHGTD